jgi:hypothetical protein
MTTKLDALMKNYMYDKVTVIHGSKEVATVEVDKAMSDDDKLEKAYMLTNTIDKPWWDNEGVTKLVEGGCRSTSVGDYVVVGATKYLCDHVGWTDEEAV